MINKRVRAGAAIAAAGVTVLTALAGPATAGTSRAPAPATPAAEAEQPGVDATDDVFTGLPSATPAAFSPDIQDGAVNAIVEIGNQIVLGGSFTQVTPHPGGTVSRSYVVAFNKDTGALNASFNPSINMPVDSLEPGPDGTSVFVGGAFTNVNGQLQRRVTRLRLSDGSIFPGFSAPASDGKAESIKYVNGRLFVGGTFQNVGGAPHAGFVTLDPATGALDPYMNLQIWGHHNDSGSGAQGAVRVDEMAVTPDGTTLVAIGNFKRVDGLLRDQIVRVSLTGPNPVVEPNWATDGFAPYCSKASFDSWVRGISMAPDGSYFVVATTGGPHEGTLCDTASRWEVDDFGPNVQPTWVNTSGGDTLWAIEATPDAVFVGGHNRWNNNPLGRDNARAGAVPSPGLMAVDPESGTPLSWNPGRHPRGAAVYDILATSTGLWLGSDTDWIGYFEHRRMKVAFFPREGGYEALSRSTGELPGDVYIGGRSGNSFTRTTFDGTNATALQTVASPGPSWGSVRGAVQVGNRVFYGFSDSRLYYRTFDGTTFGPSTFVDPYHDPDWEGKETGSGSSVYTGSFPTLYEQLSTATGMFYADGKLYYTRSLRTGLYWRWFNPDTGAVGPENTASGGLNWSGAGGMFLNGSTLYVVSASNGWLYRTSLVDGNPSGAFQLVNNQIDWRGRAVWLFPAPPNELPTASFTTSCEDLTCTVDASASSDPDGTLVAYDWTFGDGGTGTGVTTSHPYGAPGTYTITLTVTDQRGGTAMTTREVTVPVGQLADIELRSSSSSVGNGAVASVVLPPTVEPGDQLLLFLSSAAAGNPAVPAGWTVVQGTTTDVLRSTIYRRTADGTEDGLTVPIDLGAFSKNSSVVGAYSGVDPDAPIADAAVLADAGQLSHTTPVVEAEDHEKVVSYWVDRSSAASGWTVDAPAVERVEAVGTGGGRHSAVLADDGTIAGPGTLGGRTATSASVSSRGLSWSVVLAPLEL